MRDSAVLPAAGRCAPAVLLALAWSCQLLGYAQPVDMLQLPATGAAVLLGAAALGWLRPPQVGLTAPQAMLVLGAIGMLLGLMIDSHATPLALLASLCGLADRDLLSMAQLHLALLPWMHAGMWMGGLAAIPLLRTIRPTCRRQYCARLAQNVACSAWMTLGMSAGVILFEYASQSAALGPASMLGGMFSGMVWGMAAGVALYRLYFHVRAWIASTIDRSAAKPQPKASLDDTASIRAPRGVRELEIVDIKY